MNVATGSRARPSSKGVFLLFLCWLAGKVRTAPTVPEGNGQNKEPPRCVRAALCFFYSGPFSDDPVLTT